MCMSCKILSILLVCVYYVMSNSKSSTQEASCVCAHMCMCMCMSCKILSVLLKKLYVYVYFSCQIQPFFVVT